MASPALRVPCPFCSAPQDSPCVTSSGEERYAHRRRWDDYSHARRSRRFVAALRADDERFGLKAGEEVLVVSYWLDPEKVTVIRRLSDGFDPECNQYGTNIEFVRWATNEESQGG